MLLIRTLKQKMLSLPCTVSPCDYVVTIFRYNEDLFFLVPLITCTKHSKIKKSAPKPQPCRHECNAKLDYFIMCSPCKNSLFATNGKLELLVRYYFLSSNKRFVWKSIQRTIQILQVRLEVTLKLLKCCLTQIMALTLRCKIQEIQYSIYVLLISRRLLSCFSRLLLAVSLTFIRFSYSKSIT